MQSIRPESRDGTTPLLIAVKNGHTATANPIDR